MQEDLFVTGGSWPIEDFEESRRLERYRTNYHLFRNKFEEVWPDWHNRVTKHWARGELSVAFVVANFCKVLTLLSADLLCGEQGDNFGASCIDEKANEALQEILTDNKFNITAYEVSGIATSMRGDGLYKLRVEDGKVKIYPLPAHNWFPLVEQDNVKKISKHILVWEETYSGKKYLRKEIHEKGRITNLMFALDEKEGMIKRQVDLSAFDIDLPEIEETGIDEFLIVHNPNWTIDSQAYGIDDYEDIDTLVYELSVMLSRNSMVLSKHTDPNMYGDATYLSFDEGSGNYTTPVGGSFFPVPNGGTPPGYLTWDGKLEAAEKHIDRLLDLIFYISETSPAAFGLDKHAVAESGAALKKRLIRTMAKVNRKKIYADIAIRKVLYVAQLLDVAFCGGAYEPEIPEIEWQDGLPDDDTEQTMMVGQRIENGTMSQKSAIMRLDKVSEEAAEKEIETIQAERNSAMPGVSRSIAFGGFPRNPFEVPEDKEEVEEGAE